MEQLYLVDNATSDEKINYAKNKEFAYLAYYDNINGVPWHSSILCGHNPYLWGRMVANVRIVNDRLEWEERPRPVPPKI